jgi:hypothetical protein
MPPLSLFPSRKQPEGRGSESWCLHFGHDSMLGLTGSCARCLRDDHCCSLWNIPFQEGSPLRGHERDRERQRGREDEVVKREVPTPSAPRTRGYAPSGRDPRSPSLPGGAQLAPLEDTTQFESEAIGILESVFNKDKSKGILTVAAPAPSERGAPVSHGLAPMRQRTSTIRYSPYHREGDCYRPPQWGEHHPPSASQQGDPSNIQEELLRHAEAIRKQGMRFGSWSLLREADYLASFAKDMGHVSTLVKDGC